MNKIKRRLLVCLLSATCLTAGAFGISACNNGGNENGTDSVLYTLYLSDTQNGTTMSYTEWLQNKLAGAGKDGETPFIGENGNWWIGTTDTGYKAKGEDGEDGKDGDNGLPGVPGPQGPQGNPGESGENGRGISSVMMLGGELIIFYTDGTHEIVQEVDSDSIRLLKVTATDESGNPVEGAYLKLSAYNSKTYETTVINEVKTNSNGLATFVYEPVEGASYKISLADHGETETSPAIPEDYEIIYPTLGSMVIPSFDIVGDSSVLTLNVPFKNVAGSFKNAVTHGKVISVPYKRSYNLDTEQVTETNGTSGNKFSVDVKAGQYTYVSFLSYVSLQATDDDATNDLIMANATKAASGVYKITISGGTNPVLYYFNGNSGNMPSDDNGEPLYIISYTGDGSADTTANSITINNDTLTARGERIFGIKASADCKVTITVERTGDSEEAPEVQLKEVPVPENLAQWADGAAGETLTLMPITGAFKAVKGSDGFYHVNNANGPILVAQLTKAVTRYMAESLQNYPTATENLESVLHLNGFAESDYDSNGNLLYKYDYNALLNAYCAKVNKDGVYGVDDNLYNLLKSLANKGTGLEIANAAKGCEWYLPCYYYSPEGGLSAQGSGTAEDPFILAEGANTISMNGLDGSAQLSLSLSSAGVYSFTSEADIDAGTGFKTMKVDKTTYVIVTEACDLRITLSGTDNSYAVNVATCETISASIGDTSSGVSEDTALAVTGTVVRNVVYDLSVLDDGLYLNFSCALGTQGNFKITIVGDDSATLTLLNGEAIEQTSTSVTVNAIHDFVGTGIDIEKTESVLKIQADSTTNLLLIIQQIS